MIVLGADLGGTAARVVLFQHGVERSRAQGPGGAMRLGNGVEVAAKLASLAQTQLSRNNTVRADVFVVGAAGAGRDAERDELTEALEQHRIAWKVIVTTDAELARAATFDAGPGVLLIAGTGSIAVSVDLKGKTRRAGGLGWRMGDQGSGYWLGQQALSAVGSMHDGIGPATHLLEAISAVAGTAGIGALVGWSTSASIAQVAALAPAVVRVARTGDPVASKLVDRAVTHLTELAVAAGAGALPVALSGGLIGPGGPLHDRVADELSSVHKIEIKPTSADPCKGAPVLAKKIQAC